MSLAGPRVCSGACGLPFTAGAADRSLGWGGVGGGHCAGCFAGPRHLYVRSSPGAGNRTPSSVLRSLGRSSYCMGFIKPEWHFLPPGGSGGKVMGCTYGSMYLRLHGRGIYILRQNWKKQIRGLEPVDTAKVSLHLGHPVTAWDWPAMERGCCHLRLCPGWV